VIYFHLPRSLTFAQWRNPAVTLEVNPVDRQRRTLEQLLPPPKRLIYRITSGGRGRGLLEEEEEENY
jgi:hypothetical protein